MLDRYSIQIKERFFQLVAERYPISQCVKTIQDEYPDVKHYPRDAYYRYLKSEEGFSGVESALERLREEAKTHSYAHRGSRVHALVEIAENLLHRLRAFPKNEVGDPNYVRVSGEFRKSLQDIKGEVEVLGLGDGTAMDIFTSFAKLLQSEGSLPDFVKNSLKTDSIPTEN